MNTGTARVTAFRNSVKAMVPVMIGFLIVTTGNTKPSASTIRGDLSDECVELRGMANAAGDASPFVTACLSRLADRATLRLPPGTYHLRTPLAVSRPVTIETTAPSPIQACRRADSTGCAVFVLEEMPRQYVSGVMPIEIMAPDVTFRSIAVIGSDMRSAEWQRQVCLNDSTRPLGGGVRVRGTGFRLQNALIRNVSCYTALEIVTSAERPSVFDSTIGPNGSHDVNQMWADGITIHDANGAHIERNYFRDNTDVQLVFGGCRHCVVKGNTFRHSAAFEHASFAELMLHAWPNTSGDFTASITSLNNIDCNKARRCGFGIMIGGEPWYPSRASGGTVSKNRITNTLLALNVDRLTGPMTITDNVISRSGGIANSDCGRISWPAANISPSSLSVVHSDIKGFASISTSKCILLRQP